MTLYVGTQRYCPTIVVNKSVAVPVSAKNTTSNTVNAGDKVWLNTKGINVTKVGIPSIDENFIASEFSTSNYLKFNTSTTSSSPSSFEIVFKVITPSSFTSNGRVINPTNGADSTTAPYIQINSYNVVLAFYNGTSYINIEAKDSISTNTIYWFKWIYDGSNIKSYYSTDGENYTLNSTFTPSYKPFFNSTEYSVGCRSFDRSSVCVWNGSVDLSESYIKIDGEEVWRGVSDLSPYEIVNYSSINSASYTANPKSDIAAGETGDVYINGYGSETLNTVDESLDRIIG